MKVLTITNMWPYGRKQFYGIFVKEQVDAVNALYPEIDNRVWFLRGYIGKLLYVTSILVFNIRLLFRKYDVIHIHSALSGVFLLLGRRRSNAVITLHGTEILDGKQYRISKHVIKKAGMLICVSEEIEAMVLKDYPEAVTRVIPCAVRDSFFTDNRRKEGNKVKIAFASSPRRTVKNYPLFLEIIARLKALYPQSEIEAPAIDNLTREEIRDMLNSMDLLLMTSFHEGSPQIVKEALCCNAPVVSANVGTVKRMLDGVDNCAVIDGYDAGDYVDAISGILMRRDVSFPVRSTGRKRIYELKYDERTITAEIMSIYKEIQPK